MRSKIQIFVVFISTCLSSILLAQDYHVRIGTIGNSITHGVVLANPSTQAFPALLNEMLKDEFGDTCIVSNYGLTTTTMLKNGDVSYWDTQHFQNYLASAPEICFIMLGTNDTKPQNWDSHSEEYIGDYLSMIDTIKQRNPYTKFLLAYPPPAFEVKWGIRDSIIINGVIPGIDSVLTLVDADLIDFYHPLLDSGYLFNDAIHPFEEGNIVMAQMLFDKIIETNLIHRADTGITFITKFKTDISPLRSGDSTSISWNSINADSLLLDGVKVSNEGSLKISPSESHTYKMVAYGQITNDTIDLLQEVYVPELSRLRLYPTKVVRNTGDTVFFQVYYHDQLDRRITNESFNVSWNITKGSGTLFETCDTSAYFVVETSGADTSLLQVSFETISNVAQIITRQSLSLPNSEKESPFIVFPNPADHFLQVQFTEPSASVKIDLYDMQGKLYRQHNLSTAQAKQRFLIQTDDLPDGSYILKVSIAGTSFTRKVMIR